MTQTDWLATPDDLRYDQPIDVDRLLEFHAGRIVLLIAVCGRGPNRAIHGRTKLAKLDFFVRYPRFLELAVAHRRASDAAIPVYSAGFEAVEARMVRYKYGPWDHRYYDILAYLIGRELVRQSVGQASTYSLTPTGVTVAERLLSSAQYQPLVRRCRIVSNAFGDLSGTELKRFVYDTFVTEIANLALNTPIDEPQLETD